MRFHGLMGMAALLLASPALAHAFLERASPPVGSESAVAPAELSLTFTEGVEAAFSTIEVRDPAGVVVPIGKPHIASDNNRRLVVELPKLGPGTYTVIWHATSVDTHKTEGSYRFTIRS
jgi:methionine-rich copper-binding protein CopC